MTTTSVAPPASTKKYPSRPERRAKLEADLETLFYKSVKGLLRGKPMKIAPIEAGAPDRMAILPGGQIHLIELKTEEGTVSPIQKLWHERARRLGVNVHVIRGEAELLNWVAARQRDRIA